MDQNIFLSVIIPAYNEAQRISATLSSVASYLSQQSYSWEMIVVNDGSNDQTSQVIQQANIANLRLIEYQPNRGKGYAVKQGMMQAQGQYRLFMDADNSVTIDNIKQFLLYTQQGYQVIIGSIELPGANIHEHNCWYRRLLGHLAKLLIRALTIPSIHDTQRGFKLFTANAANIIFSRQTINRWGFDIELLVIAQQHQLTIKELPVAWDNPVGSKVNLGSYLQTLKELIRIKRNLLHGKYQ